MEQEEFWSALEFRVCREMAEVEERTKQKLWDFRMDLPKGPRDLNTVDWAQLLPQEAVPDSS